MSKTIVKKSKIHGTGLFAGENIPKYNKIIEYVGEIIDETEVNRRIDKMEKNNEMTYILELSGALSIDGSIGGNDSRFANHSCTPNCGILREEGKAFLYSKKNIKKDDELTFDYAFDKNEPKENCFCKSPKCRGVINEV